MGYKIASFNLCNIGESALKEKHPKNLQKIAEIILEEHFDIVGFQEVLKGGMAFKGEKEHKKKTILKELGGENKWGFSWAYAEGITDPRDEGYAFIWNKERIRLSTYKSCNSSQANKIYKPRMLTTCLDWDFWGRGVLYGRFTPVALPNVEFRLLNIHTSPKTSKEELKTIMKQIYPKIEDEIIKDHYSNTKSYTILLGDYNVQLRRDRKVNNNKFFGKSVKYLDADKDDIVVAEDWGGKRIITVQDEATTLPQKDKYEDYKLYGMRDYRDYVNDYDHFSYDVDAFEGINLKYNRVDAVIEYCFKDFDLYRDEVSDHVPISLEIEFK